MWCCAFSEPEQVTRVGRSTKERAEQASKRGRVRHGEMSERRVCSEYTEGSRERASQRECTNEREYSLATLQDERSSDHLGDTSTTSSTSSSESSRFARERATRRTSMSSTVKNLTRPGSVQHCGWLAVLMMNSSRPLRRSSMKSSSNRPIDREPCRVSECTCLESREREHSNVVRHTSVRAMTHRSQTSSPMYRLADLVDARLVASTAWSGSYCRGGCAATKSRCSVGAP